MTRREFAALPLLQVGGARKPNIVWIWADNLAYQDLSCYGSTRVKTPHIDALAQSGVRFTQWYVAHTVCSPSRAALLTGRQPFRNGIVDVLRPDSPIGLPPEEITIAALLKKQGYRTMAIGKWHLGDKRPFFAVDHGFDGYFGMPYSMDMLPAHLYRDRELIDDLAGEKVETITERYADEAIAFLRASRGQPFFLYLSHTIPHPPINLPARAKHEGRAIYDDAIEHMDEQTGRILRVIDELGLRENTLIFFSSDNGPMAPGGQTGALRGRIRDAYEGGVRVPCMASWRGRIPAGRVVQEPAITYDVFPTLARLAGAAMPGDREYDGQDIWPLLAGSGSVKREKPFYWVYLDNVTTVRDGKWKLHVGSREKALAEPELYDVETDPGEQKNLASAETAVVARLQGMIAEYQKGIPKVWPLMYPVRDKRKLPSGPRKK
ncbi:MAG: sulfatase-like hydrolase/transferase [Acidobacteria bacterium]|nr:sulfatase-like hydrolase/transferase [Acidobacteriota bacterium]